MSVEWVWAELKAQKTSKKRKETEIFRQLRKRFASIFLDLIILDRLESVSSANGYALIEYVYQKFGILLSSGTIYSTLYAIEREGLIEGEWKGRKRIYIITPEGREVLQIVQKNIDIIGDPFWGFLTYDKSQEQILQA